MAGGAQKSDTAQQQQQVAGYAQLAGYTQAAKRQHHGKDVEGVETTARRDTGLFPGKSRARPCNIVINMIGRLET